jgi:hypothetical protein
MFVYHFSHVRITWCFVIEYCMQTLHELSSLSCSRTTFLVHVYGGLRDRDWVSAADCCLLIYLNVDAIEFGLLCIHFVWTRSQLRQPLFMVTRFMCFCFIELFAMFERSQWPRVDFPESHFCMMSQTSQFLGSPEAQMANFEHVYNTRISIYLSPHISYIYVYVY